MTVQNKTPALDSRTQCQKEGDELAARAAETGNWDGFEVTNLCTEEGAKWLLEQRAKENPMTFLAELTKQPFRWKDQVFRISRCEFSNGKAVVEVQPPNLEFADELKNRIENNDLHVIPYFQGFGFIAFPEDHKRYQH